METAAEEQLLAAQLAQENTACYAQGTGRARERDEAPQPTSRADSNQEFSRWAVLPNGVFRPAAMTRKALLAGVYTVGRDDRGLHFVRVPMVTDELADLPESATVRVLEGIRRFWQSDARYREHGLVHKRGVLLWGPPGSGKTVTCQLLARDLISMDGVVVLCDRPAICVEGLATIRAIEPNRPLIVMLEDVDELIVHHGEHTLLALLDGEFAVNNIVYVATTNYPERLGARIVNRPSRFDERIYVGMPSRAAREAYLRKALAKFTFADDEEVMPAGYDPRIARAQRLEERVTKWAQDTKGLSIAHLRELVAAVLCLEQDYDDALQRLRSMCERPKDVDGFAHRNLGFE